LPGGAQEEGESLQDTALRETEEEIGVQVEASNVIGQLSTIFVPPSRFLVTPYVAALSARPDFRVTDHEVAELIETPLAVLLDPRVVRREQWTLREVEVDVPFFQIGAHKVWGATAMVLSEFAMVIERTSEFSEHSEV
jgi:8-oxo-dGTP pyrophosphatase MutT (NUDIX family)